MRLPRSAGYLRNCHPLLDHGAIWITYRPDLPADRIAVLAALATSRKDVLAFRWDVGLPAPVVASSSGQLKLESATDPP